MARLPGIRFLGLIAAGLSTGCFSASPVTQQGEQEVLATPSARCITPDEAERLADQVLQLVNLERAESGLSPVISNARLAKIAADYACRMIEGGFFGHQDPASERGPAERAVAGKYSFYSIGENLAAGQQTAAEVMKVWMESPSHRDIILSPKWREIGIGVRTGGVHSTYWVQEFGDPADFSTRAD